MNCRLCAALQRRLVTAVPLCLDRPVLHNNRRSPSLLRNRQPGNRYSLPFPVSPPGRTSGGPYPEPFQPDGAPLCEPQPPYSSRSSAIMLCQCLIYYIQEPASLSTALWNPPDPGAALPAALIPGSFSPRKAAQSNLETALNPLLHGKSRPPPGRPWLPGARRRPPLRCWSPLPIRRRERFPGRRRYWPPWLRCREPAGAPGR